MKCATITVGLEYDHAGNPRSYGGSQHGIDGGIKQLHAMAVKEYGGYTAKKAEGGWDDPKGTGIVEEQVYQISVFFEGSGDSVYEFARRVGHLFNQAAVVIEIGGDVEIITIIRS